MTAQELAKHITDNLSARAYRCSECNRPLGYTSDLCLFISGSVFCRVVTFNCLGCGKEHTWRPAPVDKLAKAG